MAKDDICWLSATELAKAIRRKRLSPVEVTRAVLDRIDQLNPQLNAFVTLTDKAALRDARRAEKMLMQNSASLGPLHGVPFSTKDLVITKGVRTTFGTPLFADNIPTEDAPMVARMKAAGGIQLGKTNTPTFGWLGVTHNLLFGPTRNPWNVALTPGGSSGGAGAAIAAGLGPLGHRNGRRRLDSYPVVVQRGIWDQAVFWSDSRVSAERSLEFVACWADDANGGRCRAYAERHGRAGRS